MFNKIDFETVESLNVVLNVRKSLAIFYKKISVGYGRGVISVKNGCHAQEILKLRAHFELMTKICHFLY